MSDEHEHVWKRGKNRWFCKICRCRQPIDNPEFVSKGASVKVARFDVEKIERLKKMIKNGTYDYSAERVANAIMDRVRPGWLAQLLNRDRS